jgi:small GTP-binding protein
VKPRAASSRSYSSLFLEPDTDNSEQSHTWVTMPDPLSITTGVVALLRVTWTIATELKKFQAEVPVVKESIGALQRDVDGLTRVLESMRDTFANMTAEHGTGIVAAHWSNIAKSVVDGHDLLLQLHSEVQKIDKKTTILDGPRKQLRLNLAEDKISGFRIHIQAYRDALQLSMQTIILSNQMSQQNSTDLIIPNLNTLQTDVRRLAMDFNQKIDSLQAMVMSQQDQVKLTAMSNLRNCVRSSASIMSTATSVIASQRGVQPQNITGPGSDFGDCFPMDGLTFRRWMDSNTVYEYDVATSTAPPLSVADVPIIGDNDTGAGSDTDSDFEGDITRVLLMSGKSRIASGDLKTAERSLRNCLSRSTSAQSKRTRKQNIQYLEVVTLLVGLYTQQEQWTEAHEMLTLKVVANERLVGKEDVDFLGDVVLLARLTQSAGNLVEAQLHARRALKGFRRAGATTISQQRSCLVLLVQLCKDSHNKDDEEAFEVMLAMVTAEHSPAVPPASENRPSYPDGLQATEAVSPAPLHSVDTGVHDTAFFHHDSFSGQESGISDVSAAAEDFARLWLPIVDSDERDHDDWFASSDLGINLDLLPGKSALSSYMATLDRPAAPLHPLYNRASSGVVPSLLPPDSHRVTSRPPNNYYDGSVGDQAISQHGKRIIATSDISATRPTPEPVATLRPMNSQSSSTQSSKNSPTGSTTLHSTSSDAGTEPTESSLALGSRTTASLQVWEHFELREQRRRSLKYLNGIIAAPDDSPVKDWAVVATANLVHLGRSESSDADVYTAIGAVFAKWPTKRNLTDPDLYAAARTVVTQLLQRHSSRLWKSTHDGTPPVGPDECMLANLNILPSGVESLLDRTIPSWRTWTELRNTDLVRLPTLMLTPPTVSNSADSQTGVSVLQATPAGSSLEPQSVDDDADHWSFQANDGKPLEKRECKAVLVGDAACGKSALLGVLTQGRFPEGYHCDVNPATFMANIELTELSLWDTPGAVDHDRSRPSSYPGAHVVLICFSIDSPDSLDNIHDKWLPEISHFCPGVPVVLVGTKSDLRRDGATIAELHKTFQHPVTYEEAHDARIKIGAKAYMECSAKRGDGIAEVFETAVRCALERKPVKAKRRRSLLRMFGMSRD